MSKNKSFKNFILAMATASCVASLTACGIDTPAYTDEEIDKIGEYAALLMLGNDPGRLVDIEESQKEPEISIKEPEEVDEPMGEPDGEDASQEDQNVSEEENTPEQNIEIIEKDPEEQPVTATIEETLGLPEGVVLTYKGYEWSHSLTDDSGSYFYDAGEGQCFLIINYNMFNASGSEQTIDFMYSGVVFTAFINQERKEVAMEMPIAGDMSTYLGKLGNGNGVDLILMFECDGSFENNISSLKLLVRNGEGNIPFILE